jgi:endo-1,4-beta-xylanase
MFHLKRTVVGRRLRHAFVALTLAVSIPAPTGASDPLRTHAADRGIFIGAAVDVNALNGIQQYRAIAGGEFSSVTAENAMKWDATEPTQGNFTFSGADAIVNFAQQNGQLVHGHTLVWHNQTPGWVQALPAAQMRAAMENHVRTVVGRYASNPAVVAWDVVNEVIDDSGNLRNSFWLQTLGQSYIADAFRFARAADADATLCLNDYSIDGINTKSTAYYNLVQSLLAQGVPVDCIGFQGHLILNQVPSTLQQNIQRFVDLGLEVRITELDIRMQLPRDATKDQQQAANFASVVNACLAVPGCAGITLWGIDDGHSWVPGTFPGQGAALLWDANYSPKPAYTAVHDALAGPGGGDTIPPTAPGAPTASNVGQTTASLSWAASTDSGGSGLAGYDVFRQQSGTDPLLGTSAGTSLALSGLTPGTPYTVYVVARDNAGNTSSPSPTTTFTTQGSGGCASPVTISLPFAQNGAGEFCWFTTGTVNHVNSWNTQLVEINGVSFTNRWSNSMPPRVNGGYQIHYLASVPWAHFEMTGTGGGGNTVPVTGVTVTPATVTVAAGATAALTATVSPANATNPAVTWSSSNTSVATVNSSGVVTGVVAGSAVVTATTVDGGFTDTTAVTVTGGTGTPCSNPTTVAVPIVRDGAGDLCLFTSGAVSFVNSWNTQLVEINGVAFTNLWSNNLPARINGGYYIRYLANVPWAHFEAR